MKLITKRFCIATVLGLAPSLAMSLAATPESGFVRTEKTQFVLNGKRYPVTGTNTHYLPWGTQDEVRAALQDAKKLHFGVVRTFISGIKGSLDGNTKPTIWEWPGAKDSASMNMHGTYYAYWDTQRNGIAFNDGADGFQKLDFVIAEAGKLGIKLNIAFMDFWQYGGGSQQMRAWYGSKGNLGRSGIVPQESGPDERYSFFYTDQRTRRDYKLLVEHVLNRRNTITGVLYRDDPTIFAWDLMNEPEFASAKISKDWVSKMAAYVKSIDGNHLLCVGSEGFVPPDPLDQKEQLAIPQVDFGTFHTYPVYHHLSPAAVVALIKEKGELSRQVGKPIVMQEFGYGSNRPDQVQVYRAWLEAADGEDGIAGWLSWRLTSRMDHGEYAKDNGEHFDFHADNSPLAAFFAQAAENSASTTVVASTPKPRIERAAANFCNRGLGEHDTRNWYLVDGRVAGGEQGSGEQIPKNNGGIPAKKLAGASGPYVQALRDTGGHFAASLGAGPWVDYDARIENGGRYRLTTTVCGPDGNGDTLFVQIIGADGKPVRAGDADWYRIHAPSDGKFAACAAGAAGSLDDGGGDVPMEWNLPAGDYKVRFIAREDGIALAGFGLVMLKGGVVPTTQAANPATRPWAPQYKLKPDEKDRLTAADVIGPDGIVYPDWRYAGLPGGIPTVPTKVRLEDFGGKPDDDQDDAPALLAAAKAVNQLGGGAIELAAGKYLLARPVIIPYDNIVIRGQGTQQTHLVATYRGPETIAFYTVCDGDVIGPDDWVEVHFNPKSIKGFRIGVGERRMYEAKYEPAWGNKFSTGFRADRLAQYASNGGAIELVASAEWSDGKSDTQRIRVTYDPTHRIPEGQRRHPFKQHLAMLSFVGDAYGGARWELSKDGKRGDRTIELVEDTDLRPGDAIVLEAPATDRWNTQVKNACTQWGTFRRYEYRVESAEGRTLKLNQPLRIDFPANDGSYAQKIYPIRRCGVERLTLEQPESELWTTGILFSNAWECWAREVNTRKVGRNAIYADGAKWCEIRDCDIQESWFYGVAGTAYVGWDRAYDCLMDNISVKHMRHGPLVQWSASGNVIRNSRFDGTDMQWHSGWTSENLFENCLVNAIGEDGSYGCGGWASPPNDRSHGPNGPRNVVYNCDVTASRDGIWLGGMNEGWIVAYNRFRLMGEKPGIAAWPFTFDLVVRGNVFSFAKPNQPAFVLSDPSCVGWEITGNRMYGGNGKLTEGPGVPEVMRDNAVLPMEMEAPRPDAPVPSIFNWQRKDLPAAH